MRSICCTFILFFFYNGLFAQLTTNASAVKTYHNTYAVVVGISEYEQGNNIPSLKYAHNDAREFADYLKSGAGGAVPPENIRLLLNEEANVAAVYNALQWLIETVTKDDLVFFYFAGHGDKESQTIFNLGFLLTYNTPRPNYTNNALRIEDLNNIANTLSVNNNANVVLITDACHSGDMATGAFHWSSLVGDALRKVRRNEIRIASCKTDETSAEDQAWGGGRGVFSWYLVNGLKGFADRDGDGIVSAKDIQIYLDSALARDPILVGENFKQNPVVSGNSAFKLTAVNKEAMSKVPAPTADPVLTDMNPMDALPMQPQEYFFNALKGAVIENLFNFYILDSIPRENIPFSMIDQLMADTIIGSGLQDHLNELKAGLMDDKDRLKRFNEKLVEIIHERGQEIINLYLKGDEAELERRRYYNIESNGYDEYPIMFSVAAKLTSPENYLQRILRVDQHYFAGVIARVKIPTVKNPKPLLQLAMDELQQALKLDDNAAYIHNELGTLYLTKKEYAKAEESYTRATQIAPDWAIPWANLCGLYAAKKNSAAAINAGRIADSLQDRLQITSVNLGFAYEDQGNKLSAEEYYRKAIDINSRHYLPFESLGYVYMSTTQYAAADSFFYEADLRKKGYHFNGRGFNPFIVDKPITMADIHSCFVDSNSIFADDVMSLFSLGDEEYKSKNYSDAERIFKKIIAVDKTNPLVYHYLGMAMYKQKKWEDAEIMFQFAFRYFKDDSTFRLYCDSVKQSKQWPYDHSCVEDYFETHYYGSILDNYFISSVYELWGHYEEAEENYRRIIQLRPDRIAPYVKLWRMMERLGRFTEAEKIIRDYGEYDKNTTYSELNSFYKRAIEQYPSDANWPYKLGLLLYDRAERKSADNYLDTIVYFPLLNKEVFLDLEQHNKMADDKNMFQDEVLRNSESNWPAVIGLYEDSVQLIMPGTLEKIYIAPENVYTPRKDAITYLSQAASIIKEPEPLADINLKIGNVYVWAGSKKQAFPYYLEAIQLAPENAAIRLKMIEVAHALYKNTTALENLQYLYDQNQINFPDRMLLAEFDIHSGNFAAAKKILQEAEAIHPYNVPAIHDLNGRLLLLSSQFKQAIPVYKQYLSENPRDSSTMYTIGRLYAQSGNTKLAWQWLETSLKNGFNYSWVLKYDPVWDKYRKEAKWNAMMERLVKRKTGGNKE